MMTLLQDRGQRVCAHRIPMGADASFSTMLPFSDFMHQSFPGCCNDLSINLLFFSHPSLQTLLGKKKKKKKVFVEGNLLYLPSFNLFFW